MRLLRSSAIYAASVLFLAVTAACGGEADQSGSADFVGNAAAESAGASALTTPSEDEGQVPSETSDSQEQGAVAAQGAALNTGESCEVQTPLLADGQFPMGCPDAGFAVSPARLCCPDSASGLWATSSDAQGLTLEVFFDDIKVVCEKPGTYQITWGYGDCATVQTFEFTCVVNPLGVPGDSCVDADGNPGVVECGGHGMKCAAL